MCDFWCDVLSTVAGGAFLAFCAWLKARVPEVAGVWTFEIVTTESAYNPYRGLKIKYIVLLSQRGADVTGVAEKVYEVRADGSEHEYIGVGRRRAEVAGGLVGNLFQKKRFQFLLREYGVKREFATIHNLVMASDNRDKLEGNFISSAANSSGTSTWVRGIGKYNFKLAVD